MTPFRLGVAGFGRMGRTHVRALAGSDLVAVTAVADVSHQARAEIASSGAAGYASLADMLDAAAIDGVLIAAPTDQHSALIAQVTAAGLPMLCEKPCGLTAAAARASADAVRRARVPFQAAYWRRHVPGLKRLRDQIMAGDLGELHLLACYQWDEAPPSDLFREHSGGIGIDMGVHEFDQMSWLTGQEVSTLAAVGAGPRPDGRMADVDSAQAVVSLAGGASGIISLGRFHPGGDVVWVEAFGTERTVRCDVLDAANGTQTLAAALRRQAESFAAFTAGEPSDGATPEDAVAALATAERLTAAVARFWSRAERTVG
jgi:myo-inositol 2-dehydrogenase/D-chiro-inositol 1-dehydrogenase